mgnify:CR=1 FL=1
MLFMSHIDWLYNNDIVNCWHWRCPFLSHSHTPCVRVCEYIVLTISLIFLSRSRLYMRFCINSLSNLHTWQRHALFFIVSSSIHSYWTSPRDFLPPNATYTRALMTIIIPPKYLGQRQGNVGSTLVRATHMWALHIHINLKAMYLSYSLTLPHILILSLSLSYGGWYIYLLSINI